MDTDKDNDIDEKDLANLRNEEESSTAVAEPEQEEAEVLEPKEKEAKMSRKISPEDLMAALTNFEKVLDDLDLDETEEEETEGE